MGEHLLIRNGEIGVRPNLAIHLLEHLHSVSLGPKLVTKMDHIILDNLQSFKFKEPINLRQNTPHIGLCVLSGEAE